jgi:hypothetical protein
MKYLLSTLFIGQKYLPGSLKKTSIKLFSYYQKITF